MDVCCWPYYEIYFNTSSVIFKGGEMELILVRHGESIANTKQLYCGWLETELTDKGINQGKKVGKYLKCQKIDKIFSSSSKRALDTAININRELYFPVKEIEIEEDLRELYFGLFEGKTYKEICNEYKEEADKWFNDYINYSTPQGESLKDLALRSKAFLNKIKKEEGRILCITHGGTIKVILSELLGLDLKCFWSLQIDQCCVVKFNIVDGYAILKELRNDI